MKEVFMSALLPLPTPVHPSFFYSPSSDKGKDLLVYTLIKDTTSDPPPVASLDPSNTPMHSETNDSLLIALRKGKRSCTNHPISNFMSYKS